MNDIIRQRAREWVQRNGYDSSFAEGAEFYTAIEVAAEGGDLACKEWLIQTRSEAGHRVLLAAANADRVLIPTAIGPRTASVRGSIRHRTTEGVVRQREMFEAMTVGQYLGWYRQRHRELARDEGELAAHARVVRAINGSSHEITVAAALANVGKDWDELMGSEQAS